MSTKILGDNAPYNNCYHLIASTKYRKNVFNNEEMRSRLEEIIQETMGKMEGTSLIVAMVSIIMFGSSVTSTRGTYLSPIAHL